MLGKEVVYDSQKKEALTTCVGQEERGNKSSAPFLFLRLMRRLETLVSYRRQSCKLEHLFFFLS